MTSNRPLISQVNDQDLYSQRALKGEAREALFSIDDRAGLWILSPDKESQKYAFIPVFLLGNETPDLPRNTNFKNHGHLILHDSKICKIKFVRFFTPLDLKPLTRPEERQNPAPKGFIKRPFTKQVIGYKLIDKAELSGFKDTVHIIASSGELVSNTGTVKLLEKSEDAAKTEPEALEPLGVNTGIRDVKVSQAPLRAGDSTSAKIEAVEGTLPQHNIELLINIDEQNLGKPVPLHLIINGKFIRNPVIVSGMVGPFQGEHNHISFIVSFQDILISHFGEDAMPPGNINVLILTVNNLSLMSDVDIGAAKE
ncbi:hypothetical protein [Aestuariibacter salexigens]|uniref:hypothetical protein n=1 Tax=Aestuariibacter salexigens TaxID=226010 RepID=UPI0003FF5787|nr:hypothetical protein [Aestuariibacter salexigens]